MSKDGIIICKFLNVNQTGKYNFTLIINNEEMNERIFDEVILFDEKIIQRDLRVISPSRNFYNITDSLERANLSI